jgi:hypothetical protein
LAPAAHREYHADATLVIKRRKNVRDAMPNRDDPELLNAVQVLTDAVRRERIPGVVEFRQLEDALKEISVEPTDNCWAAADAAFKALDPDLRQRVADRAQQLAYKEAKTRRSDLGLGTAAAAPPAPSPTTTTATTTPMTGDAPPPAKQAPKAGASPFLSALNRGKLGSRK